MQTCQVYVVSAFLSNEVEVIASDQTGDLNVAT